MQKSLFTVTLLLALWMSTVLYADTSQPSHGSSVSSSQGPKSALSKGVTLTLSVLTPPSTAEKPVILEVTMKNVTDHDIDIPRDGMGADAFSYSVVNPDFKNEPVPPTLYGMGHIIRPTPGTKVLKLDHNVSATLHAGEELHTRIWLNRLFDMSRDVRYVVSVSRRLYGVPRGFVEVSSNTVEVTVLSTSDQAVIDKAISHRD